MKNLLYLILALIIFIIAHTCYSQDTLNSKHSKSNNNTIRFILNSTKAGIIEGISKNDSFDIYPSKIPNSPVIIFYYGGKYHIGNKSQYKYIAKRLVKLN